MTEEYLKFIKYAKEKEIGKAMKGFIELEDAQTKHKSLIAIQAIDFAEPMGEWSEIHYAQGKKLLVQQSYDEIKTKIEEAQK